MRAFNQQGLLTVSPPKLTYIFLAGFIVIFSITSRFIKEKLFINEVILGTALGILVGPYVANILNPRSWTSDSNALTLELLRIVLVIGLFTVGVELPKSYMWRHAKGLLNMVVPTMMIGWVIVAGFIHAFFTNLNFVSCLVVAACLTPTDPIISASILGGKYAEQHVPLKLRQLLSAESAANDGLAFPFLSLAMYLTLDSTTFEAISDWMILGCLYQVILGTVIGALLGLALSHILRFSQKMGLISPDSYLALFPALSILISGIVSLLGSDDLLAAFAAGCAIAWDGEFKRCTEGQAFASVLDFLLNSACFIYIGAWTPFSSFNMPNLGLEPWRLVILFILVLVARRIPAALILYKWIPEVDSWRGALFCGHFDSLFMLLSGPIGVSAIFVSCYATSKLPIPQVTPQNQQELLAATLQPIVSFMVLGSIITHGLSAPFSALFWWGAGVVGTKRATLTQDPPPPGCIFGVHDCHDKFPVLTELPIYLEDLKKTSEVNAVVGTSQMKKIQPVVILLRPDAGPSPR